MYQFMLVIAREGKATRQAPAFLVSFLVAAVFYRFHSFALECLAFLATWFVLDFVIETAASTAARRAKSRTMI